MFERVQRDSSAGKAGIQVMVEKQAQKLSHALALLWGALSVERGLGGFGPLPIRQHGQDIGGNRDPVDCFTVGARRT